MGTTKTTVQTKKKQYTFEEYVKKFAPEGLRRQPSDDERFESCVRAEFDKRIRTANKTHSE